MKILLVGSGGREHALALGLKADTSTTELHCAPGNPGIADLALQKNQALGGRFVEDLKGAAQSLASTGRNPTAIAKSMDQLEPLIQHSQFYQQGLENAIAKNRGDVQIKRQFDNAMIKAYDPQALGAYNAFKAGGEPALNKYLMDIAPDKSKPITPGQKANIFLKIQKYSNLVNGDL